MTEEKEEVRWHQLMAPDPLFWLLSLQGVAVQHNTSAGIIMTNQSLVLQKLKRSSAGIYVCKASNIEGEGSSNAVELNIMCKLIVKQNFLSIKLMIQFPWIFRQTHL